MHMRVKVFVKQQVWHGVPGQRLSNKEARSLLACAVAALRMFLEEHALRPCRWARGAGSPVSPELLERLLGPLDACRALCMRAPRGRDPQLVRPL